MSRASVRNSIKRILRIAIMSLQNVCQSHAKASNALYASGMPRRNVDDARKWADDRIPKRTVKSYPEYFHDERDRGGSDGWRSGHSYSRDLRDRVMGAVDGGMAVRDAATMFKVSIAYIYNGLIRRRLTGDTGVKQSRGRQLRKLSPEQERALGAHIRSRRGITLAEAQAWLLVEHSLSLCTAMWKAAKRLGLSFIKSPARFRAGPSRRGDTPQAVEIGSALHRSCEPCRPRRNRREYRNGAPRWLGAGRERCRDGAPFGHCKTMTPAFAGASSSSLAYA